MRGLQVTRAVTSAFWSLALAIRCLWPASQITARLGAIAMPKSVSAALVATAEPDRRNYYLVHAAEDCLCDWKPTDNELDMLQRSLHITCVEDSARWMGRHKDCYWHWLQCQLPTGKVSLTTLKLTHPAVVPRRDRIAAPMRVASWIRFETVMTSDDWEGAISLGAWVVRAAGFSVQVPGKSCGEYPVSAEAGFSSLIGSSAQ